MDFRLSTEQELFQKAVREFAEKKVMPRARDIDEKEAGIPDEIIAEMAELGIFGVTIPEEYGGSAQPGEGLQYARIAVEEIGRAELSMSLPVYTLLCIGWSYLLLRHGTEPLKRSLLPKVAAGENFLGICTTEPSGGSDLGAIKTSARREGDRYILNGEKVYISGVVEAAQRGGGHLVLFRTDPEKGTKGMTFAYVPVDSPGVTYTTFRDMGRMGLSTGGLRFQDVEVPVENVLGQENRGFYVLMEGFNAARVLVSAACVGAALRALEMRRDYTKQRVLFGIPLVKNEGVSFDIADGRARLEMLKLSLQKAAWMIDEHYKDGSFTQKEINETVAICKLTAPLLALEIVRNAMMHHGAFGYTRDCDLEMAFRGLMSYVVGAEGGANIMRLIIAREFVGDVAIPYR